jgi:hypothetical protein
VLICCIPRYKLWIARLGWKLDGAGRAFTAGEHDMSEITIGDVTGTAELKVDDASPLASSELGLLISGTATFIGDLSKQLDATNFTSTTLDATFKSPNIALGGKSSLSLKAGSNAALTRYTSADTPLLGGDPSVPEIDIAQNEFWLSFELDGTLTITASADLGTGFGVSVADAPAVNLSTYVRFTSQQRELPNLGQGISATLNSFRLALTPPVLRAQKFGTVYVTNVSGTVTVSGSYSVPAAVNQLALAEALIPFKVSIDPAATVKVSGSVALTGDHSVRAWKRSEAELILGLFKKRGTTLAAKFSASAGIGADAGKTELIETFFNAVAPTTDLRKSGLTKGDPRYNTIHDVLEDSVSRAFEISVNGSAAASFGDQAALLYSIDLTANPEATDTALNAVLAGDWSPIARLPNARELRNVVASVRENKFTLPINLLGIFNYESVSDFVSKSTVVHDYENGSITITDKSTAARISVASTPYRADPQKLRSVLYEGALATAAYAVAGGTTTAALTISQSIFLYHAQISAADLRKELRFGVAIGELTTDQFQALPIRSPRPAHVLIDASQQFKGAQVPALFFSDRVTRTPHDLAKLIVLGRTTLATLLDESDPVDRRRIEILRNDTAWAAMDDQKFPVDSPASYTDWYDVTFWANSIHNVAKPLNGVLAAIENLSQGADPSKDENLKQKAESTCQCAEQCCA